MLSYSKFILKINSNLNNTKLLIHLQNLNLRLPFIANLNEFSYINNSLSYPRIYVHMSFSCCLIENSSCSARLFPWCGRFLPANIKNQKITSTTTTTTAVLVYDGDVLPLTKVSRNEMGAYLCIATNGVPPSVSKRIILDVECK